MTLGSSGTSLTRGGPWLLALLLLALAPAALAQSELPPAERYKLRVEYLWWSPGLVGEVQKGFSDNEGTVLDVQADLGIPDNGANLLHGSLRLGQGWKFRGSWTPLEYQGDVLAARAFTYGTTVVVPGQQVKTLFKGNYFTSEIEKDLVERPQGFLGLLLGVKYLDVDAVMLNVDTQSRVAQNQQLPLPVLGLAGRAYLGEHLSFEGEFSGLPAGDRGHVYELLLAGRAHLSSRLAGTIGWRKLEVQGKTSRDYFKLGLSAWTFGVEISL